MTGVELYHGDCLEVLRGLPSDSIDAIVTDPPYGLTANKKGGTGVASVNLESPYGRARIGTGNGTGGFMGLKWDSDVPPVEVWVECLRVLKPGGHLLAFAGTRTQHRMAVRIEDAGFEIRDMIAWVYGSGFPKSLDVSKAIDKAAGAEREKVRAQELGYTEVDGSDPATDDARQWQGWGTALKPALEPITVARKPLIGTVAENVLRHGTGGLNIDGCRVPGAKPDTTRGASSKQSSMAGTLGAQGRIEDDGTGRWPANLIHDGSDEVLAAFPQAPGQLARASTSDTQRAGQNAYGVMARGLNGQAPRGDAGSAARFFYCAKASKADRDEGLDALADRIVGMSGAAAAAAARGEHYDNGDGGVNRTKVRKNHHPTVKPTDLMRYLCRS